MSTVVLISCVSKKLQHRARARDLYVSPLFRMNLKYAQRFSPKNIFILSAKYGLIDLDEEIVPYDVTLNNLSAHERKNWARKVIEQLREYCDLENDHFVILAGKKYRQYLMPYLQSCQVPLAGLPIGKQLQFLKEKTGT
ncbi:hypothetical protein DSN97_00450 [Deferribacteraceae bacterium V6Fe1]|nr:hypothetical protein DSN97_00450 [Deferribacteraceae bacterium V6Fe1]